MTYRLAGDIVVVIHFAFVVFVVIGGVLVEGVLYPGDMLRQAQFVAALVVVGSWIALGLRRRSVARA